MLFKTKVKKYLHNLLRYKWYHNIIILNIAGKTLDSTLQHTDFKYIQHAFLRTKMQDQV